VKKPLEAHIDAAASLGPFEVYALTSAANKFEAVLAAELGVTALYVVTKKSGFDTSDLIGNGEVFFPPDLAAKVPEAVKDVQEATKCIAYELPTAAGFHLHRANESVCFTDTGMR
jgi:hypothetical protein